MSDPRKRSSKEKVEKARSQEEIQESQPEESSVVSNFAKHCNIIMFIVGNRFILFE